MQLVALPWREIAKCVGLFKKAISVEDGGGTNNKLVWPGGGVLFVSFLGISDGMDSLSTET